MVKKDDEKKRGRVRTGRPSSIGKDNLHRIKASLPRHWLVKFRAIVLQMAGMDKSRRQDRFPNHVWTHGCPKSRLFSPPVHHPSDKTTCIASRIVVWVHSSSHHHTILLLLQYTCAGDGVRSGAFCSSRKNRRETSFFLCRRQHADNCCRGETQSKA